MADQMNDQTRNETDDFGRSLVSTPLPFAGTVSSPSLIKSSISEVGTEMNSNKLINDFVHAILTVRMYQNKTHLTSQLPVTTRARTTSPHQGSPPTSIILPPSLLQDHCITQLHYVQSFILAVKAFDFCDSCPEINYCM